METTKKIPKVSVCVVTYNQEKYIRQCLQSIVDQVTDFDFEVLVGEDCSTDGTRAIVQEFADKYPDVVKPIFHEKNIGAFKNFVSTHNIANGIYIAHCDGDDYWLPSKLKNQCDYLDENKKCSIVWHRVWIKKIGSSLLIDDFNHNSIIQDLKFFKKDILLIGSIGCHSSKMYRASPMKIVSNGLDILDFFTDVEHIGDGYATILNKKLGVYRKDLGVSSSSKTIYMYLDHLEKFALMYPEYKYEISANAFIIFLASVKNRRKYWYKAMKIWIDKNPFLTILMVIRLIPIILNFRAEK